MQLRFGGLIGRMMDVGLHLSVQSVGIGAATVIALAMPAATWGIDHGSQVAGAGVDHSLQAVSGAQINQGVQLANMPVMQTADKLVKTPVGPINLGPMSPSVSVDQILKAPANVVSQFNATRVTGGVLLPFRNPVCSGCLGP